MEKILHPLEALKISTRESKERQMNKIKQRKSEIIYLSVFSISKIRNSRTYPDSITQMIFSFYGVV